MLRCDHLFQGGQSARKKTLKEEKVMGTLLTAGRKTFNKLKQQYVGLKFGKGGKTGKKRTYLRQDGERERESVGSGEEPQANMARS